MQTNPVISSLYRVLCYGLFFPLVGMLVPSQPAVAGVTEGMPIRLAGIFADGMVLQRELPVPVWGWASPGRTIEVCFAQQTKQTVADASGFWRADLDPLPACRKGRTLTVRDAATGKALIVNDVLVGEVWFTAGQSNMMMGLASTEGGEDFFRESKPLLGDQVRVVHGIGPSLRADTPQEDIDVTWKQPSAGYSAVSYHFAAKLYAHFKGRVPIGVVTFVAVVPAEAWVDRGTLEADPSLAPVLTDGLNVDAACYNGVIAPVAPFAVRGILYYQGEYNGGRGEQFRTLMPAVINTWRRAWQRPELPFLFVQLPGFISQQAPPSALDMDAETLASQRSESAKQTWTELRDAQLHTWLTVPDTGMAVTIDVGEPYDIHPPRKEPVAERLFLQARAVAYGEEILASGPVPKTIQYREGRFVVTFDHCGNGLAGRDGDVEGFELAGDDGHFHPAEAILEGNTVVIRSPDVPLPRQLRYGWSGHPTATLINTAGLPATPFRWSAPETSGKSAEGPLPFHRPASPADDTNAVSVIGEAEPAPHTPAADGDAFFRQRVEPLLRERCFDCHAHDTEISGGLALDVRSGWQQGGRSGPAVVPGDPEASLLLTAVRQGIDGQTMPPDAPLAPDEIATLVEWVRRGAPDPRELTTDQAWEQVYTRRLDWWSLQPLRHGPAPAVSDSSWPRSVIDQHILARLEAERLNPAPPANRRVLIRRLAFVLNGLPPKPEDVTEFLADERPDAFERLVHRYLASPHFGERWARHWMDLVHYADTHGYEWDIPAKNAWRYRDYLVRAFNADLPYDRFILEQIAGDLILPRTDPVTGVNESLVATMALRMGERWHGDNAAAEPTTAFNLGDSVDTLSKTFLATTVGCARCHDHKLDAIAQADYYRIFGTLMSSRWGVRSIDTTDPNVAVIEELRQLKNRIRQQLAARWLAAPQQLRAKLEAIEQDEAATDSFPESFDELLRRPVSQAISAAIFAAERQRRIDANAAHLTLLADFTAADAATNGWRWEGLGMQNGLVQDGEPVIADEGDQILVHLLPAGRWSHVYSSRLGGAVRSPELWRNPPLHFSVGYGGGRKASHHLNVDRAIHSERVAYADREPGAWLSFTAGHFKRLAGLPDSSPRRVYFECATKAFDNYFPPRSGYPGFSLADEQDPRSWFGVTRVYAHPADSPPRDELGRFLGVLDQAATTEELPALVADRIVTAIENWATQTCSADDVMVINEALTNRWLDNRALADPALAQLVSQYRQAEARLEPDRTIGALDDWNEAADATIFQRGDPAVRGAAVPRGTIRFLQELSQLPPTTASGRLSLARSLVHPHNPLTARVLVNRVWHHLFGAPLVRSPDDFGHLGDRPSHPELLDTLAKQFVEEGWSIKKLISRIVTSATWQQASEASPAAVASDPDNRLWHHWPAHRLEAEAIRDAMLAVAGRLNPDIGGPPTDPFRTTEDAAKRLFSGPLDGNGRRSIYLRMTLMEPPRFLALFNQPSPQVTVGIRDRSTVPEQALALLNDPFVRAMADSWARKHHAASAGDLPRGIEALFEEGLGRPPTVDEQTGLQAVAAASQAAFPQNSECAAWQAVTHTILLMPEFSHVK